MNVEIQVKLFGMLRQYRPPTAGGAPHHPFSVVLGEPAAGCVCLKSL